MPIGEVAALELWIKRRSAEIRSSVEAQQVWILAPCVPCVREHRSVSSLKTISRHPGRIVARM